MAATRLFVEEFLQLAIQYPVLDVRSPGEYSHAHIPGAHTFPLFTDEERKVVGTAYKQESRQKAIKIGLNYFGPKMVRMTEEAERIAKAYQKNTADGKPVVLVHCWRGGMRSAGVAWLLDLYGFKVYTLAGGYKMYRNWVLQQFEKKYPIHILGGYTGSGKTYVLDALRQHKTKVIDLEELASHKGSAFGNIGMPAQPSQEMFENKLAGQLWQLSKAKANDTIWMEDESQRIGDVNIPAVLFKQMRTKPVFFLDIPFEERLKHIVAEYGPLPKEKLVNAIIRIKKRLGGLDTKNAVNFLIEEDIEACFSILLKYYDKQYLKGLHNREDYENIVHTIACPLVAAAQNAAAVLKNKR
ncbi:MAG: tRNA 2-selenouridine(34) synthase MnmH [Bacteroidota bacterium]|nr:tRNA 2-selenouridine(34) synthase MnmH [Bacteroidota bacterium]